MKITGMRALVVAAVFALTLTACVQSTAQDSASAVQSSSSPPVSQSEPPAPPSQAAPQIYLYGEQHGVEKILDKEFELWSQYYQNEGMRHLFVELPYYTACFLNVWMKENDDTILDAVYNDWEGTASQTPDVKAFYQKIKRECPETIFHGTDVGHQYHSTGERFLRYLKDKGLENSAQYRTAQEAIEQGKLYYDNDGNDDDAASNVYRENTMVKNFIREFDGLQGESIMGIYGAAHTEPEGMEYTTQSIPCMANQLDDTYTGMIQAKSLVWIAKDIEPQKVEQMTVNGKTYQASYFGKEDMSSFSEAMAFREFWRLENAYDDFKDFPKDGDVLPDDNYPMLIKVGQVFVVDFTQKDGSVLRMHFRSDGNQWEGRQTTERFIFESNTAASALS